MELDTNIYERMKTIQWFSNCGKQPQTPPMSFPVKWCESLSSALSLVQSDKWSDAKTEAQGDLTGYLAKNHCDAYGGHWNRLAKASRKKIQDEIMPIVGIALSTICVADSLEQVLLLDLNRIALQAAYKRRFRNVPDFFEKLLDVYENGFLPCGWEGALRDWPTGEIIVF